MRFKRSILLAIVVMFAIGSLSTFAMAQDPQSDETITVKKRDLSPDQIKQLETKAKIESYGNWVGLGDEVGKAVNSSLVAITDTADRFSKTGVGKFTMFIVAYKIIGTDIIQLLFGLLLFFICMPIWLWSYRKNCVSYRYLASDSKEDGRKYAIHDGDSEEKLYHMVIFFVILAIVLLVIFP